MYIGPWQFAKNGQRIVRRDDDGHTAASIELVQEPGAVDGGDYTTGVLWPGQSHLRMFNFETLQEAMAFADRSLDEHGHICSGGMVVSTA